MYGPPGSTVFLTFCIVSRCLASPVDREARSFDQRAPTTTAAAVQQGAGLGDVMIHGWWGRQWSVDFDNDAIQSKVDMLSSSLASYELLMTFATPATSTGGLRSVLSSQLSAATNGPKKARAAGEQSASLSLCIPIVSSPGQARVAMATDAASAPQAPGILATVATVSSAGVDFPYLSLSPTATANPPAASSVTETKMPQTGASGPGGSSGGGGSLQVSGTGNSHKPNGGSSQNVNVIDNGNGNIVVHSNDNGGSNINIGSNGNVNINSDGNSNVRQGMSSSGSVAVVGIGSASAPTFGGGRAFAPAGGRGGGASASVNSVSVHARDEVGLGTSDLWSRATNGDDDNNDGNSSCRYPQLNGHRLARDSTGQIVILVEDPLQGSAFAESIHDIISNSINSALGQAFGQSFNPSRRRRGALGNQLAIVVYGLGDIIRHGHL